MSLSNVLSEDGNFVQTTVMNDAWSAALCIVGYGALAADLPSDANSADLEVTGLKVGIKGYASGSTVYVTVGIAAPDAGAASGYSADLPISFDTSTPLPSTNDWVYRDFMFLDTNGLPQFGFHDGTPNVPDLANPSSDTNNGVYVVAYTYSPGTFNVFVDVVSVQLYYRWVRPHALPTAVSVGAPGGEGGDIAWSGTLSTVAAEDDTYISATIPTASAPSSVPLICTSFSVANPSGTTTSVGLRVGVKGYCDGGSIRLTCYVQYNGNINQASGAFVTLPKFQNTSLDPGGPAPNNWVYQDILFPLPNGDGSTVPYSLLFSDWASANTGLCLIAENHSLTDDGAIAGGTLYIDCVAIAPIYYESSGG